MQGEIKTVSADVERVHKGEGDEDDEFERSSWGGQLEFILTCVGFAVGLGNVWRFPYLVYENGGGAFLIPYFLMLIFVGLPLFYMEVAFGQFASLGPITAYNVSPILKGVGVAGIIVAAYIVLYYNIIVAWCIYYFFASMNTELPWVSCNNWWNTETCLTPGQNTSLLDPNVTYYTSSEEYYYNQVLRMTDSIDDIGGIRWQLALCLLVAWCTIFIVLLKGIASLGKVSYFVSLFPYVLLTIMLARGLTLDGASTGIEFYLKPDFSRLLEAKVWADAATQIFYSLGISMGGLIAMASFNDFHNNIKRDALIIPIVNCGTSFYAGFVIFSVLGYMAKQKGVDVGEVAAEGPGLVFVVYPEGLATMPGAPIWSVLFFFMMTTLGFSSQFSTAEGVISAFVDEFPEVLRVGLRPTYMRATLCFSFFLLGLPMVCDGGFYWFQIMDNYTAGYTLLIVGFGEIMAFQFVYGYNRFAEDIALMLGSKPGFFWQLTWRFLTPAIIAVVFISKCAQQERLTFGDYVYPDWAMAIAWLIVMFPCVTILVFLVYRFCTQGGYKVLKETAAPTESWGPARKKDRIGVYAMPTEDSNFNKEEDLPPYWLSNKPIMKMSSSFSAFPKPPSYNGNGYNVANDNRASGLSSVTDSSANSQKEAVAGAAAVVQSNTTSGDNTSSAATSSIEEAVVHVSSKKLDSPKVANKVKSDPTSKSAKPSDKTKKEAAGFVNPGFQVDEDAETKSNNSSGVGSIAEAYDMGASTKEEGAEETIVTSEL